MSSVLATTTVDLRRSFSHDVNLASIVTSLTLYIMATIPAVASILLFPILILAQQCFDKDYAAVNASDSIRMQPIPGALTRWNISTAVAETTTGHQATLQQKYWIAANASSNITAANLPCTGCMFILQPELSSKALAARVDNSTTDNGCAKALSSECQQGMIDTIANNLMEQVSSSGAWACTMLGQMLAVPPKQCNCTKQYNVISLRKFTKTGVLGFTDDSLEPFGNPGFIPSSGDSCNPSNPAEYLLHGSATANSLYEQIYDPVSTSNMTYYDSVIGATTPVIIATWSLDNKTTRAPQIQMACLTPQQNVAQGSRSPISGAAPSTTGSLSTFVAWVALLAAAFILC